MGKRHREELGHKHGGEKRVDRRTDQRDAPSGTQRSTTTDPARAFSDALVAYRSTVCSLDNNMVMQGIRQWHSRTVELGHGLLRQLRDADEFVQALRKLQAYGDKSHSNSEGHIR